ncbi:MAG: DUF695 domain-containing protein [Candidatus Eremiobacteraeota bacterium]|nr:DUF695 domain-containing protein [Candidatus Eremiobacteraeota bacterium]
MADWSSYFARLNGAPVSIAVDLELKAVAPLPEKPAAYTIAVAVRGPDQNGMPAESEFQELTEIEDALYDTLAEFGVMQVGRVTGRKLRTFHYYGPQVRTVAEIAAHAMQSHPDYKFKVLASDDPTWAIYNGYLYPDRYQLEFAEDMKVLQALRDAGDDFEKPRDVRHRVRFADVPRRTDFVRAIADHGYAVNLDTSNDAVDVVKREAIDPFAIAATRTAISTLAQEFAGIYEGWTCEVQA